MKKALLLSIFSICVFLSCKSSAESERKFVNGQEFILVRKSSEKSSNISEVELWRKIGDKRYYYTPSLDGTNFLLIDK